MPRLPNSSRRESSWYKRSHLRKAWSLFPERHMLTSDWSNHALLLVAYIYGYVLAATPALGAAIDRQWPAAALAAAASTTALSVGAWTGIIPGDLPILTYDLAVRAELLSADGKNVIATVFTPSRRFLAVSPPKVKK